MKWVIARGEIEKKRINNVVEVVPLKILSNFNQFEAVKFLNNQHKPQAV